MVACGIPRIDDLNRGVADAAPISPGDADRQAVGAVQDLLAGQRARGMPSLASSAYGLFGPATTQAIASFRAANGLPSGSTVDAPTLQALVRTPAPAPRSTRAYLALVLDFAFAGMAKCLCLTSQVEGAGAFAALNLNTDKAGLSYGLIQWAQSQLRLREILTALNAADRATFVNIFGSGQAATADGLLAHVARSRGGTDADGDTTDAAFDLVASPWADRFRQAALVPAFQRAQVATALSDFRRSYTFLQGYATKIATERQVAFMLDLANQYGDGGARRQYQNADTPAADGDAIIRSIADAAPASFQARRQFFLATGLLDDAEFVNA